MVKEFDFETINIEIPKRNENSHKGDFGRVAVLGGSEGMGGAAILYLRPLFVRSRFNSFVYSFN